MKSIKETITHTIIIKKSQFICTLIPCSDFKEIDSILLIHKNKYLDANHHCMAYIVDNQKKANDDGEPSNTAGKPMLNVLERQELNNVIAIVSRYFGGIKLGAGGLTRAYTQSIAEALKQATIVEKQLVALYTITIDYSFTKKFEHLLKTHAIRCENIDYLDQVVYTCYIKDDSFFTIIQDLTNNNYQKKYLKEVYLEVYLEV